MMIPINRGNNVDVQRALHFDLDPPWLQVNVTKYLDFVNLDVWRVVVCVRFSSITTQPISPMMIPINWGNNVDVQCHFILTLTPPWLQVKVTKYFDFVNLDVWRVVVCVRFSSKTTWPNSPMLMPIYRGNNVDLQHILHFDLHPSMTAGQDHKILQFCELRLLPWHEYWYMSGPYKVAGDRLVLFIITQYFITIGPCVLTLQWISVAVFAKMYSSSQIQFHVLTVNWMRSEFPQQTVFTMIYIQV